MGSLYGSPILQNAFSTNSGSGSNVGSGYNSGSNSGTGSSSGSNFNSSAPVMIPGMQADYQDLLSKNVANYGNMMNAYQGGQQNLQQQLPNVNQGYGQLGGDVMNTLGLDTNGKPNGSWGVAAPAAQAIGNTQQQQVAQNQQQMTNSGLGNTTVGANMNQQAAQQAQLSYGQLGSQLAGQAAGYQSQIGQAGLGAQMQGLGMQTGLTQGALGTLASPYSNTAGALSGTQGVGYGSNTSQNAQQGAQQGQNAQQGAQQQQGKSASGIPNPGSGGGSGAAGAGAGGTGAGGYNAAGAAGYSGGTGGGLPPSGSLGNSLTGGAGGPGGGTPGQPTEKDNGNGGQTPNEPALDANGNEVGGAPGGEQEDAMMQNLQSFGEGYQGFGDGVPVMSKAQADAQGLKPVTALVPGRPWDKPAYTITGWTPK